MPAGDVNIPGFGRCRFGPRFEDTQAYSSCPPSTQGTFFAKMPESRKTSLKSAQHEKKGVHAYGKANSGSNKKDKAPFTVGPVMLAVFLFVVVGSAVVQIISSAQKGLV
ncbi:unnamed protein product [Polarella glacialis]|uniref:Stress-associated endoplasmic reticulum protein n=1 Tax=Polarella glacialis TaxID=89957 RepID=A0A813EAC7_POLGL|nr:unnamed protein product [Polarella glacialis]